jgi:hypothetical protein
MATVSQILREKCYDRIIIAYCTSNVQKVMRDPSSESPPNISYKKTSEKKRALKGHGNEADFLGFLQKSVGRRFLTLHFEPFQFGLHIHGDIRN